MTINSFKSIQYGYKLVRMMLGLGNFVIWNEIRKFFHKFASIIQLIKCPNGLKYGKIAKKSQKICLKKADKFIGVLRKRLKEIFEFLSFSHFGGHFR